MSVFSLGYPDWTNEDIKKSFKDFEELYLARPIKNNDGGMKCPHAFATYFMIKRLQPKVIIESGVWKGLGTWIIEQACPTANIFCLDINFSNLEYKSKRAEYIKKDFSLVNFEKIDKNNTLCFFDDHQNALLRLQQMKWKGFVKAIFEDNYSANRGDCYSLKKILSNTGFYPELDWKSGFQKILKIKLQQLIGCENSSIIEANSVHSFELIKNLNLYYEFPPLFKEDLTRWGDQWNPDNYPTKPPIFDNDVKHNLRKEALDYTWICLIELK